MRYHLGPLPAEEVERYVDHRLRVAGWDPGRAGPLWDEDAIEALAELSRGILGSSTRWRRRPSSWGTGGMRGGSTGR